MTFNATEWIAANTIGGTRLTDEANDSVASFTTMWNFFESTLCDNHASIGAFQRAIQKYQSARASQAAKQTLQECLSFWQFRYKTPDGFNDYFDSLYFRQNDKRDHVEDVLIGLLTTDEEKLLALMIITYRLRNNLFHGLKTLDMLNYQVQNLNTASRCLAAILELIPTRFVETRNRRAANH